MEVEVDKSRIRELRIANSWSQETLAEHAKVSLRTIQRMDKEGIASLKSRLAVASALEIHPSELSKRPPAHGFAFRRLSSQLVPQLHSLLQRWQQKSQLPDTQSPFRTLPDLLQAPLLLAVWSLILVPAWFVLFVFATHLSVEVSFYATQWDALKGATAMSIPFAVVTALAILSYRRFFAVR